jgi:hypothetical protein
MKSSPMLGRAGCGAGVGEGGGISACGSEESGIGDGAVMRFV